VAAGEPANDQEEGGLGLAVGSWLDPLPVAEFHETPVPIVAAQRPLEGALGNYIDGHDAGVALARRISVMLSEVGLITAATPMGRCYGVK